VTKADGTKFGKTAGGAVWLDPQKTSPYSFYQFWLNTSDADVIHFLNIFTFLPLDDIAGIAARQQAAPEKREAQKTLALEVTRLLHGDKALESAQRITDALFSGGLDSLTEQDLDQLKLDGMDSTTVEADRVGLLALIADSGLASSRGQARKLVAGNGIRINGEVLSDTELELDFSDALFEKYYLLRRGKKNWHLVVRKPL
jgi:tyrosyl-tRNA synthetase